MAEHLRDLSDAELGRALVTLGRQLDYPDAALSAAVAARLRGEGARPRPVGSRRRRLLLAAVTLLTAAVTGTAVAGGLGLPGIGLRLGRSDPGTGSLATDERFLGERLSLDEARARVRFDIAVPTLPDLPAPEVYVADQRVSLVYPDLLITQFVGAADTEYLLKRADFAEPVTVAGSPGWWIEGQHEVGYLGGEGLRNADSALIWIHDGVTRRLEVYLSRQRALQIALSMDFRGS